MWPTLYRSLVRVIDSRNRTLLALFEEVHESLSRIYPLIPPLELSSKFEVVISEIESQIVRPFHVVLHMLHKADLSDPSMDSNDETIV